MLFGYNQNRLLPINSKNFNNYLKIHFAQPLFNNPIQNIILNIPKIFD